MKELRVLNNKRNKIKTATAIKCESQTNKKNRPTDKQTDRQSDRQTNRQTQQTSGNTERTNTSTRQTGKARHTIKHDWFKQIKTGCWQTCPKSSPNTWRQKWSYKKLIWPFLSYLIFDECSNNIEIRCTYHRQTDKQTDRQTDRKNRQAATGQDRTGQGKTRNIDLRIKQDRTTEHTNAQHNAIQEDAVRLTQKK